MPPRQYLTPFSARRRTERRGQTRADARAVSGIEISRDPSAGLFCRKPPLTGVVMSEEYEHRFLSSEVPPRPADQCLFHVIPVPYEATVSYGRGTARGPEAILAASDQLELFDGSGYPGNRGIFTHQPVRCDCAPPIVHERIAAATLTALAAGGLPVLLGGEHSLTYGALKALKEHSDIPFGVVQFDAHADLRDTYEGSRWSHACVMRRAVDDLGLPLAQIGNRLYCEEEREARSRHNVTAWDAPWLAHHPMPEVLLPENFPRNIFLTFDVDGLDPSVIAETGTPVPGGLGWYQALDLAALALRGRRMIGFDVVELAPRTDRLASDFAAARLVYALMGLALADSPAAID